MNVPGNFRMGQGKPIGLSMKLIYRITETWEVNIQNTHGVWDPTTMLIHT